VIRRGTVDITIGRDTFPHLYAAIDQARSEMDELAAEVSLGVRGADHFNDLEARAAGILSRLRAAFRSK